MTTIELIRQVKHNALSLEQCEALPTKRLLTYYKMYSQAFRSYGVCGCCYEILEERDIPINKAGKEYMDDIKTILDLREHVS